jgi:hypothetical protein
VLSHVSAFSSTMQARSNSRIAIVAAVTWQNDQFVRASKQHQISLAFEKYEAKLKQTQERVRLRGAYTAKLGADFNPAAFNAMYRELDKTRGVVAKTCC